MNDKSSGEQAARSEAVAASRYSWLPNLFSISRLLIAPFIFFSIKANDFILVAILAAWAVLSDFWDGFLARRLHSISDAGKILDPLADKLCVASGGLAAAIYGDLPVLLLALMLARDLCIGILGLFLSRKIKAIPTSNPIGKVTVTVLAIALAVYVFKIAALYLLAFWLSIIFIAMSSLAYLRAGIQLFLKRV